MLVKLFSQFLTKVVSRRNGVAVIYVYRKSTHTDRYLDFSSHHEIKHKISTASTLLFRVSSLPSSHGGKTDTMETNHVRAALEANGYPSAVISNFLNEKLPSLTVPPPEELVSMVFKWAEPSDTYKGFACLPYISGLTEPLTRLLRNNEIRVVNKPFKTLEWDNLQISNVMLFIKSLSLERHRRSRKMLPNPNKGTSTKVEELCKGF